MSMQDFQSALAGGAPPGGPPPGPPPDAPPPDGGAPPLDATLGGGGDLTGGPAPQFQSSMDALDAAEEALHAFIQLDPDEADRVVAAQCLQNVITLKASNQKSVQGGDMKSLQRALAGGTGY